MESRERIAQGEELIIRRKEGEVLDRSRFYDPVSGDERQVPLGSAIEFAEEPIAYNDAGKYEAIVGERSGRLCTIKTGEEGTELRALLFGRHCWTSLDSLKPEQRVQAYPELPRLGWGATLFLGL